MNLTAMTGVEEWRGMALLILQGTVSSLHPTGCNRMPYNAYAPWPMVRETIRKGKSFGSGAAWDWFD